MNSTSLFMLSSILYFNWSKSIWPFFVLQSHMIDVINMSDWWPKNNADFLHITFSFYIISHCKMFLILKTVFQDSLHSLKLYLKK